jgi:hypothetical protein
MGKLSKTWFLLSFVCLLFGLFLFLPPRQTLAGDTWYRQGNSKVYCATVSGTPCIASPPIQYSGTRLYFTCPQPIRGTGVEFNPYYGLLWYGYDLSYPQLYMGNTYYWDCYNCGNPIDVYHIDFFDTNGCGPFTTTSIDPVSISFLFPTNETSTPDFLNWSVDVEGSTSTQLYARIDYGRTPAFGFYDAEPVGTGTRFITKTNPLLINTDWYAQASLYDWNTLIATSSVIHFYVSPTSTQAATYCGEQASSTCSNFGLIGSPVCMAFACLFLPTADVFAQFNDLGAALSQKPPVGYFYATKDAMDLLTIGLASSTLINTSTSQAFSAVLSPLHTGLAWLLWFLFAWWIIHRIRKLEI